MTSKYKVRCSNEALYSEIKFCLERANLPFAQKDEKRPVVCRADSDIKVQEAFLDCLLSTNDYSIHKKVGEAWIEIPHDMHALKEEENDKLSGLSDRAKRIYQDLQDGEQLDASDLAYLVYNFEEESEYGDNRRWTRSVDTIVELGGKYYSITWEQGLTENQENEFWEQPVEVEKHEYPKTIMVTEWKPVGQEKDGVDR